MASSDRCAIGTGFLSAACAGSTSAGPDFRGPSRRSLGDRPAVRADLTYGAERADRPAVRSPEHPGPAACGPTHLSGRDAEKAGESPRPRRLCLPGGSDEVEQGPGRRFRLLEKAHVTGMLEPYGTCPGMTRCELSGCRCADVAVVQVRQACAACFPGLSQKNDCPRGLGQSRKKVTEKSCARKNRLNLNMSQRYEKFPPPLHRRMR